MIRRALIVVLLCLTLCVVIIWWASYVHLFHYSFTAFGRSATLLHASDGLLRVLQATADEAVYFDDTQRDSMRVRRRRDGLTCFVCVTPDRKALAAAGLGQFGYRSSTHVVPPGNVPRISTYTTTVPSHVLLTSPTQTRMQLQSLRVPAWFPALALAAYPVAAMGRSAYRRHRQKGKPCCRQCGYNLTGNVSGICPECGREVDAQAIQKR